MQYNAAWESGCFGGFQQQIWEVKMIKEIGDGKQNLVYFTAHNFFSLIYDDQENVSEKHVVYKVR